jgi:hypothetical protein
MGHDLTRTIPGSTFELRCAHDRECKRWAVVTHPFASSDADGRSAVLIRATDVS